MKVRLTMEFDIGDFRQDKESDPLSQILFDEVVSYAACGHLRDTCTWLAEAKNEETDEQKRAGMIARHHQRWGRILAEAKSTHEVIQ